VGLLSASLKTELQKQNPEFAFLFEFTVGATTYRYSDMGRPAAAGLYEAKVLLEIEDSEFDRAAPLHAALASLIASSDDILRKSGQLVAAKDAADAAARRALQAIKASEGRRKR
jgi:hypothetical protein